MALIKLLFTLLMMIYIFGAAIAVFIFIFDVIKWHPREQRFQVVQKLYSTVSYNYSMHKFKKLEKRLKM